MKQVFLTTIDNPFNPYKEFDSWFAFDSQKGYNSLSYLARIVDLNGDTEDYGTSIGIERAIDEILEHNLLGIYKKVIVDDEND